jgi:hypothetical protein
VGKQEGSQGGGNSNSGYVPAAPVDVMSSGDDDLPF